MSRFEADGTKTATNLFEAAAWHYSVRVSCGWCTHMAIFDAHVLWWLFHRKGWDDNLAAAAKRFACMPCRRNYQGQAKGAARITLGRDEPTEKRLPFPPETEWKRAISRFRS